MRLHDSQVAWLLQPIQSHRVAVADGHSHLPQQDVRAHLTRIFGFGGYSVETKSLELVFEEEIPPYQRNGKTISGRWNVCWRATVRLTIFDLAGEYVTHFEGSSAGDAQNQSRIDGHDLALKSAESTALKRAATNLGDQFGLSLYNKGSEAAFVRFVVGHTSEPVADTKDEEQVPAGDAEPPADIDGPLIPSRVGQSEAPPPPPPVSNGKRPRFGFAEWLAAERPEWPTQTMRDVAAAYLITKGVGRMEDATDEQYQAMWDEWRTNGIPEPVS